MNQQKVYLTFPIEKEAAHFLTSFAHINGMTQPELLETICMSFIDNAIAEINDNKEATND